MRNTLRFAALGAAALAFGNPAHAQLSDQPYPGTIALQVDLTDAARKIFRVSETIPVQPGKLDLSYPKWIPGEHSPSGPIEGVTGLTLSAGGKRLPWRRDLVDMYTIHVDVPAGVSSLELAFQFLSPTGGGAFGTSVSATSRIVDLEWNQVLFYPGNHRASDVRVEPSARLPSGWGFASALETAGEDANGAHFKPVSVETLVDSPLIAGRHFKRIDLAPGAKVPVHLDIVADHAENLALSDAQLAAARNLVTQAQALFGAQHYDHYDFLFTLSESTGHFGLEHHQSSDDRQFARYFTDAETYLAGSGLLPHEYVHSWNGKFRRPEGLATPNLNVPMRDDLLWVYEGLTQYYGEVLAARCNMRSAEQYRDNFALFAGVMDKRAGRSWRPLQDTADEAQILYYAPDAWQSWRRRVDFYPEGNLLWLDVDTTIRETSGGKHSLDDFARAFYGMDDGSHAVKAYTFDDVVAALNAVQPNDWAAFLRQRLDATDNSAPFSGIARSGWKLVYTDTPTAAFKAYEKVRKLVDLSHSLGVIIDADKSPGMLEDVIWNSPAFNAGLAPHMKIIAVDDEAYDADRIKEIIKSAAAEKRPIKLLAQNQDTFTTVTIDYHDGLKYPRLERLTDAPNRLDDIVRARK
jgi:predicted metalloprotease with PDZ domain